MITAAWPPVARIGARRPLRLARRLPALGWDPVVLTPTPDAVYKPGWARDASLVEPDVEVHRVPTLLPSHVLVHGTRHLFNRMHLPRLGELTGSFIRDARFIDRFVECTPALLRAARRVDPVDAVWVTGGPFGLFPAAALIARALNRPLMLDYRDHWTNRVARPKRSHPFGVPHGGYRRIERALLGHAQAAAFVNQEIHDAAEALCPEHAPWDVVPNGFDPLGVPPTAPHAFGRPTLIYAGSCYDSRSMAPVLRALAEGFGPGDTGLQLVIHGALDPKAQAFLRKHPLPGRVHLAGHIGMAELAGRLKGADAQLLIIGETHGHALTGKVFDYFATGRPILGVGPEGAAAQPLITSTGTGLWASTNAPAALIAALRQVEARALPFAPVPEALAPWSADAMAQRTAARLNTL
jgi:glycosyltransferase involved in cell wall biosynthesis